MSVEHTYLSSIQQYLETFPSVFRTAVTAASPIYHELQQVFGWLQGRRLRSTCAAPISCQPISP
jgi:hypothetical protein